MTNFVTLTCPTCGAKLEITDEDERCACIHCGNEHVVKRGGGKVSLKPVIESIGKVQKGVDKTASELAIKRLESEISKFELLLPPVMKKLYESTAFFYKPIRCHRVLEEYFMTENWKAKSNMSFREKQYYHHKGVLDLERQSLGLEEMIRMCEYFSQDPIEAYKNNGIMRPNKLLKDKSTIAQFLHVRELLAPVVKIRGDLMTKIEEIRKHRQIVSY